MWIFFYSNPPALAWPLLPIKVGQDHLAAGDDDVVGGVDAVTDQVADVMSLCYNTTWTLSLRLVRHLVGEGTVVMVMIGGNDDYGDDSDRCGAIGLTSLHG